LTTEDRLHILKNFKWPYLCNALSDSLYTLTSDTMMTGLVTPMWHEVGHAHFAREGN